MRIEPASVDSVIIYFANTITKENSLKVKAAYRRLKQLKIEGFIEIIPSYTSILITYDIFKYDFNKIKKFLYSLLDKLSVEEQKDTKPLIIDVYYGIEVGLDLQRVATIANISIEELISIHSQKVYDVYAIGFLPGFAYLASVDDRIKIPRLKTPRKKISKGSVAIADLQTAVYPQNSPGGWNILGKTTYELFDKNLEGLSSISIESKIKFNPITKEEFISQGGKL